MSQRVASTRAHAARRVHRGLLLCAGFGATAALGLLLSGCSPTGGAPGAEGQEAREQAPDFSLPALDGELVSLA